MKWWLLGGVCLGVIVLRWLHRFEGEYVSTAWLVQQAREGRLGHEGPSWNWPVRKLANEQGAWNARRLKKRA